MRCGATPSDSREDYVEEAWRIVDPAIQASTPIHEYEPGTWGPKEAERMVPGGVACVGKVPAILRLSSPREGTHDSRSARTSVLVGRGRLARSSATSSGFCSPTQATAG